MKITIEINSHDMDGISHLLKVLADNAINYTQLFIEGSGGGGGDMSGKSSGFVILESDISNKSLKEK